MASKRTGAALARGKSKQDYQTPPDFMSVVRARFGRPGFDLAAIAKNAQAPRYFTKRDDSLKQRWPLRPLCWLNPPFDNIAPWAEKCAVHAAAGGRVLFLVPASVGSNWFRDLVFPYARTLFLNDRLTFVGQTQPYPKDCMLCVFDRELPRSGANPNGPGCEIWNWKSRAWPRTVRAFRMFDEAGGPFYGKAAWRRIMGR